MHDQNYLEAQNAKPLFPQSSIKLLPLSIYQLYQLNPHDLLLLSQHMLKFQTLCVDDLGSHVEASSNNELAKERDPSFKDWDCCFQSKLKDKISTIFHLLFSAIYLHYLLIYFQRLHL